MSNSDRISMRFFLPVGIILLAAGTSTAEAQQNSVGTPDQDTRTSNPSGDAIVVTARRRAERLIDVPVSISVVSAEAIKDKGITAPVDLVQHIPSLQQSGSGFGDAVPHFTIRGQRQQQQYLTVDQSVGVYADEVAVPRQQGLNSALFDLTSVQVLKGPQGTLFGKNQTGGAILFSSQMPTENFEGYFTATIGNYQARKFEGAINVPLSSELQIRLAGVVDRRDGYLHNVTDGRDYNDRNSEGWRASVHYAPQAIPLQNWLIVGGANVNEIGVGTKAVGIADPSAIAGVPYLYNLLSSANSSQFAALTGRYDVAGVSQFQRPNGDNVVIRTFNITNKTEVEVSDGLNFRNIFGYRYLRSFLSANTSGLAGAVISPVSSIVDFFSPTPPTVLANPASDTVCSPSNPCTLVNSLQSEDTLRQKQYSNEFHVYGKLFDNKLDYIVGGYYFKESGFQQNTAFGLYSAGMQNSQARAANISKAIFSQVTWRTPLDGVSLTGGVRKTWDTRKITYLSTLSNYFSLDYRNGTPGTCALLSGEASDSAPLSPCSLDGRVSFSQVTYTASADWHVNRDIMLYATTRKGYRAGGFNVQTVTPATTILAPFQPETVTDYEFGLKSEWTLAGLHGNFNAAYYRQNYSNIQRTVTAAAAKSAVVNAAKAKIEGVELEGSVALTPWLDVSGFLAYINPKFTSFTVPAQFVNPGDITPAKFSGIPKYSGGSTVTFHQELPGNSGKVAVAIDMYTQSSTYAQDNNYDPITKTYYASAKIPGYTVFNVGMNWKNIYGHPLDAAFNVKNIGNKYYFTGGVDVIPNGLGSTARYIGEPRMFTVSLTYRFN